MIIEDTNFRMTEEQRQHSSERLATDINRFFATIFNDGSIEELEACCYSVIQDVLEDRDEKYQELADEAKRYLRGTKFMKVRNESNNKRNDSYWGSNKPSRFSS